MKPQTRLASLKEQGINIAVGFSIQTGANFFILPLFGMRPSIGDLLGIGGIMTVISVIRGYVIRRVMEKKRAADVPPDFQHVVEEIAAERDRQIKAEGYSLAHDDEHRDSELARAAAAYAFAASLGSDERARFAQAFDSNVRSPGVSLTARLWPWNIHQFNPTHARRDLIKAGALVVAQIGVLDRAKRRGA